MSNGLFDDALARIADLWMIVTVVTYPAIKNALQDVADTLEATTRRLPGETGSPFGTRLHDMFQRIIESAEFNFPEVDFSRVLTEVQFDKLGKLVGFGGKPGGSPKGTTTADFAIVNKGLSNDDKLVDRVSASATELVDYKTGKARLSQRQKAFAAKNNAPLSALKQGGELAKGPARGQRGSAALGTMFTIASVGLLVGALWNDFSAKNAFELTKGILAQEAMTGAARAIFGKAASGAGTLFFFLSSMRSDNAKFSAEEEAREDQEMLVIVLSSVPTGSLKHSGEDLPYWKALIPDFGASGSHEVHRHTTGR